MAPAARAVRGDHDLTSERGFRVTRTRPLNRNRSPPLRNSKRSAAMVPLGPDPAIGSAPDHPAALQVDHGAGRLEAIAVAGRDLDPARQVHVLARAIVDAGSRQQVDLPRTCGRDVRHQLIELDPVGLGRVHGGGCGGDLERLGIAGLADVTGIVHAHQVAAFDLARRQHRSDQPGPAADELRPGDRQSDQEHGDRRQRVAQHADHAGGAAQRPRRRPSRRLQPVGQCNHATPARRQSCRCNAPTGRLPSTTNSTVIAQSFITRIASAASA